MRNSAPHRYKVVRICERCGELDPQAGQVCRDGGPPAPHRPIDRSVDFGEYHPIRTGR